MPARRPQSHCQRSFAARWQYGPEDGGRTMCEHARPKRSETNDSDWKHESLILQGFPRFPKTARNRGTRLKIVSPVRVRVSPSSEKALAKRGHSSVGTVACPTTGRSATIAPVTRTRATTTGDHGYVAEQPTPRQAKRAGRAIRLRSDWETVKYDVMLAALRAKFAPRRTADRSTAGRRTMLLL